jgi:diguanylate cyclase (GGDEF)-like protein
MESARTGLRSGSRADGTRLVYDSGPSVEQLRAEVAKLKDECDRLRWFVGHDELTGLANRRLFSALAPSRLKASAVAAVLLMDLNGFKPINDAYGHEAGDRVLQIVAQRLDERIDNGLIARLGGDEFVGVLTPNVARPAASWWIPKVTDLLDGLAAPMRIAGRQMSVTASIGVAVTDATTEIDDLMHHADMAMYEAKIHGVGFRAWDPVPLRPADVQIAQIRIADDTPTPLLRPAYTDVPDIDPYRREPADITPAGTYQPDDPVWVYRHGAWHPGRVESASRRAVMATYWRMTGGGTVVDTMGAECVLERGGADRHPDRVRVGDVRPVA